jgi:hypothetical protein
MARKITIIKLDFIVFVFVILVLLFWSLLIIGECARRESSAEKCRAAGYEFLECNTTIGCTCVDDEGNVIPVWEFE